MSEDIARGILLEYVTNQRKWGPEVAAAQAYLQEVMKEKEHDN